MNKKALYDILKNTDVEANLQLDLNKSVHIAEWGDDIDEDTLLILTKKSNGKARNVISEAVPYAVICEKDDGGAFDDSIKLYTENARKTLATCYYNYYGIDVSRMKLIAITGTNGKTTVSRMLRHILRYSGGDVGYIGTGSVSINETELEDKYYSMTTPDPKQLYGYLSDMQKFGCEYVILEASSHAIALGKLAPLLFDVGAFTNLSEEHRDFHKDMVEYLEVKASLFKQCRYGIFNLDCPYSRRAYAMAECNKGSIGIINRANAYATDVQLRGLAGSSFFYRDDNLIFGVDLTVAGVYNIYNAMMAISIAIHLGIRPCVAKQAINSLEYVEGRMEVIRDEVSVVIDYAHTPFAVENILKSLYSTKRKRQNLILVVGCGGEREINKRKEIGRIAEKYCDRIILTEDNSRSESTEKIIEDILEGISDRETVSIITDRRDAIYTAILDASAGDIIALLGKGREGYIIGKDGFRDFSDRSEALYALRMRRCTDENNA